MPPTSVVLREVRRFAAAARPEPATDRELLGRFVAARDGPAFAELVRRHGPLVLGLCRRVLGHAADADDAFQAAFLVLVRKAHAVADPDRLGAWLYGVAWRTANKVRTARRALAPLPDDLPDRRAAAADWPVELDAAIAGLPEKYRVPVVLCHLQGLTPAEAAGRLGCPLSTVATRLSRARDVLRKRLAAGGLAVPAGLVAGAALHVPFTLTAAVTDMAVGRILPTPAARLAAGAVWSLSMTPFRTLAATALVVLLSGVGLYGLRAGGQGPATPPAEAVPPPAIPAPGCILSSANFQVSGPSARICRLLADAAERARREFAVAWLGKELPTWDNPVRVNVTIQATGATGATTFQFRPAAWGLQAEMQVSGPLDRLLADLIPHEVTHCVLADHFRKPLPRWADEGISLMSESEGEQDRHAALFPKTANGGELIQTRVLFELKECPAKVLPFYVQSIHVTKFLVGKKDRPTFVAFVRDGMAGGWEAAAKKHYGFASLDDLEAAYLEAARPAPSGDDRDVAPRLARAKADGGGRITVYLGVPPSDFRYSQETRYEKRKTVSPATGKEEESYVPVTTMRELHSVLAMPFAAGKVRVLTPDGKPVDAAAARKALGGETPVPVVVTYHPAGIDPAFAAALRPGTLVLVLPPVGE